MRARGWGVVGVALAAVVVVRGLRARYRQVTIDGDSMLPTFQSGARVLVRRSSPGAVRRGDVIVFTHPWREQLAVFGAEQWMIKRVVAVAGDIVPDVVRQGLGERSNALGEQIVPPDALVPEGTLVVLGDNSSASTDSRHFGLVRCDAVLGVVVGSH